MSNQVCKEHDWKYSYVRGRTDIFANYPFPVWMAQRVCRICRDIEVLAPLGGDFNSGGGEWKQEYPLIGGR